MGIVLINCTKNHSYFYAQPFGSGHSSQSRNKS